VSDGGQEGLFQISSMSAWDDKDELRRLDLLAGVVAQTSLAGAAASGALVISDKLASAASDVLIGLVIALGFCTVSSIITLAFNPAKVVDLKEAIEEKRRKLELILIAMVIALVLLSIGALGCQVLLGGSDHRLHPERAPRTEFVVDQAAQASAPAPD
jgi:hypothetical protein